MVPILVGKFLLSLNKNQLNFSPYKCSLDMNLIINVNTGVFYFLMKREFPMKRFRNFENISNKEYDFIEIEYNCVYKISSKTFYKWSRIESIENTKK